MPEAPQERKRLEALAEVDLRDATADPALNDVATLAARLCETPIALINLVGERRQWSEAAFGIGPLDTPREDAFCDYVIRGEGFFEIEDARADVRFRDNPLVIGEPFVVFYGGMPLATAGGLKVGTLSVIDRRPRHLNGQQIDSLRRLAAQVVALLEARRTSAERHRVRRIFDLSPTAIAMVRGPDFVFEELNDTFRRLTGFRNHLDRPWREVFPDPVGRQLLEGMKRVYRTGDHLALPEYPVEVHAARGPDEKKYFDITFDRIAGENDKRHRVLIRAHDVSERVRATADLAESRQRLSETLRALPVGVSFLEGPEHRYSFVNEVHSTFYGGRTNFVGRTLAEAVPELMGGPVPRLLDHVFRTGESYFDDEFPVALRQPGGEERHLVLQLSMQALRDVAGQISGVVATSVDVTDRVRTREDLRETERLLSAATTVAGVGFFEWRIPEDVVTFNDQMQRSWGIPADVSLTRVMERIWPADRDEVATLIRRSLDTGEPYFAQYRILDPAGPGHLWVEAQGEVRYDSTGAPISFFGTAIDITSRKTVETDAQAVANSIPQLAWMADHAGRMQWFNQRWYEFTGETFESTRGWGWQKVQHPEHADRVATKFLEHVRTGRAWEDTFPLRRFDGVYRWFLSRAVPLKDDAGNVVRWFGSNTDVTDQREAERELARLAAVVENSGDFVCLLDRDLTPKFVNPGGRALVQFDSARQNHLLEFFVAGERGVIERTALPEIRRTGTWEGETVFLTAVSRRAVPVWLNLFTVRDPRLDQPIAYAMIGRDISERRAFERSLEEAKDAAERANAAKSVFLANMSHEIRSPLGAIMGFADLMANPNLAAEEVTEYVGVINRNSQHLLRIVDDILDLSKVEAGKMMIERTPFSLNDLLADLASLMGYRARDKGIGFDLDLGTPIPECVLSDSTRLRQILVNIVGNAIKFTDHGGVRLTVTYDDAALTFTVADTGPGIAREDAARLFRAFEQADVSTTRRYGGTGLGLVLTQRLAEAMGGRFWLRDSAPGRGSTFVATVPVVRSADGRMIDTIDHSYATDLPPAQEAGTPLVNLNVLVIEDSPDNQALFELILNRLGANVTIAADGIEGVAAAGRAEFDVILCDVQMPRMDGYAATRELRRLGFTRPIVALTAHAMKEERERALRAGFDAFLSKPLRKELLVETLTRVIRPRNLAP